MRRDLVCVSTEFDREVTLALAIYCVEDLGKREEKKNQQCRFSFPPTNVHVKTQCVYVWSTMLPVCQQRKYFMRFPSQRKGSLMAFSPVFPTEESACSMAVFQ